jgi:RHS repeat-associated protein
MLPNLRQGVAFGPYTIGDDVVTQYDSTNGARHLLYDGQGSTRQLVDNNEDVTDAFSYDGYGVMLGANPANAATSLLYTGEMYDSSASMYYLRARWYDQQTGRFNRMDPFAGNTQDPQSLHKYLYCHANPVNMIDPSGLAETCVQTLTVWAIIGEMIAIIAPHVLPALSAAAVVLTLAWIYELTHEYIAAGLTAVASVIRSYTKVVAKAISDAAKALGRTVKQLRKFKLFPIIRRFGPKIFAFNVAVLATHPWWFMLNYNGVGSLQTGANRLWVAANYGFMMLTAPPGYQLDEFPYACTAQGGWLGPAMACPVPAWENALQGGFLGPFTRWALRGLPQPFIVVPIPL